MIHAARVEHDDNCDRTSRTRSVGGEDAPQGRLEPLLRDAPHDRLAAVEKTGPHGGWDPDEG